MIASLKRYPPGIWAAALVLIVLLYVPLSKTFELFAEYQTIKIKSAQNQASLEMVNHDLPSESSVEAIDPEKKIFELLSHASTTNGVRLKQIFLPVAGLPEKDVIIYTQQVTLQGSYVNMLKCLQEMETSLNPIKIASMRFNLLEEKQVSVLQANVYFQYVNFAK